MKEMSRDVLEAKNRQNLPIREVAVEFVYSLKKKRRSLSFAKMYCSSTSCRSLLLPLRTSTAASVDSFSVNCGFRGFH